MKMNKIVKKIPSKLPIAVFIVVALVPADEYFANMATSQLPAKSRKIRE